MPSGRSSLKIMHFFNVLLHSNILDRKHKEVQQFILWNLSTFCAPGPNRIAAIFKHFFCKLLFAKTSESICLIKDFNSYLVTAAIPNPTRFPILIKFVKKKTRKHYAENLLHIFIKTKSILSLGCAGLELARVPRVPGTRRNSEYLLWHPLILRFLILTGTRKAHSL